MVGDEKILEIRNLCKVFSNSRGIFKKKMHQLSAVNNVSFNILQGETLGIIGQSGSGKTTVARIIMGLETASSGSIIFKGQELSSERSLDIRKNLQIVFQDSTSTLDPRMMIRHILQEPIRIYFPKLSSKEINLMLDEAMEQVNMPQNSLNKYPHELSGGQQQRINIAKAIITKPDLIIFDEPTSSLDVSIQAQILNLLKRLQQEHHLTYLFITHDMGVVNFISDHLVVMKHGEIVESGSTDSIINNPQHPYTKLLMDAILDADPNHRKYVHNSGGMING